jgi:hypothetical protein
MMNFSLKKDHRLPLKAEWSKYYQKSFDVALLNWEINRQEERLELPKSRHKK